MAILTFFKENKQLPGYNYNDKNDQNVNKQSFGILQFLLEVISTTLFRFEVRHIFFNFYKPTKN
jgi:hypothetical protein